MPQKLNIAHIKERAKNLESNVKMALSVAAVVILWMLTGIFSSNDTAQNKTKEKLIKEVQVIQSVEKPYTRQVKLSSTTQPYMLVNLGARIEGQVESIQADKGQIVKKGQILLTIEKEQRAETLKTAQLQLKQAQSLYSAAKKLNKEGYRADTSLDSRKAELAKAEEFLKSAENDLSFTEISSPIDGLVEDRLVEVGDFVKKGTLAYQIVSQEKYKIVAHISQKDRDSINLNSPAFATLVTGREVSGTVSFIATNAHAITHTYKVEVEVDSQEPIPTGMSAELRIPSKTITAHFIPYAAMLLNDKGNLGTIVLDTSNTAKFMPINPLDDDGEGFYLNGLPSKVSVVVKGQSSLVEGEVVKPHVVEQVPHARKLY
tara:strand:- start:203266 stop:204387 length:1122 start_codon:yes stop_codon:yes gene_type:complete